MWWCRVVKVLDGLRGYGLIVGMWFRSTLAYRASFLLTTLGNAITSWLEFAGILIIFSHVDQLGGFSVGEVALMYATASCSLGLADLFLGNMDQLGARVRDGSVDTMLIRPVPLFAQVAADRFVLRRVGRIVQGLLVLGWALAQLRPGWSVLEYALLAGVIVCGAAIFGALWALGGAFQFWAQDAAQVQNSVTYGGNRLLQYPPTIYGTELVRGVTYVVPLAFVNWVPLLRLLDRDDPLGLPGWVDFLSPLVAVAMCALTALLWRVGVRSYRSTGS